MTSRNHESLLISAILNNADASLAKGHGIVPAHFFGYRAEYEWIVTYDKQYARCPDEQEFLAVFPTFPHTHNQTDARWPANETYREYAKRNLKQKLTEAAANLGKNNVEDAYAAIEAMKFGVVSEKPKPIIRDHGFLDDYDAPQEVRVPVPWKTLQEATNGIGPGELWYFGARQGQGKSSMLIDMGASAVMAGLNVAMYSLEMTKRQVQVRLQADLGRRLGMEVNAARMLHRTWDKAKYKDLLQTIDERVPGELFIHESSMGRVTPAVVAANVKDFDLVIVDYVGLMRDETGTPAIRDHRIMAEISNELKAIALTNHARILGASQINREGDLPGPNPPKLKNMAQSDHLGNDGDVVITMKRYTQGVTMNSIEKNRHGDNGKYFTLFDANRGDFREISAEEAEVIKNDEDD